MFDERVKVVFLEYEISHRQGSTNEEYVFQENKRNLTLVQNYLKHWDKVLPTFDIAMLQYVLKFSFGKYAGELNQDGTRAIMPSYILCEAQIKDFADSSVKRRSFFVSKFNNWCLNKTKLCSLKHSEELIKAKHHNTEQGLDFCLENTSLYNKNSEHCTTCIHKRSCRKILKNQSPELFEIRK